MENDNNIILENPGTKRKPPKLKAIDRSISIAIDNYIPSAPPRMIIDDSLILEENPPPPPIAPPSHIITKPDIYFVGGTTSTSPIHSSYDDCPHHLRKSNFRRSDTLDIHSPSNFQMRKTHSFHTNEPTIEEFMLSTKRTNSVRGSYLFPQTTDTERTQRSPSPSRRGCRMHRSFNEPSKRPKKSDITIEGIKYPSLNDEILHEPDTSLQELNPANKSFGSEILRSRSNSHTKVENESIFEDNELANAAAVVTAAAAIAGTSGTGVIRKSYPHKHSSHSLDQQKQYNFKRGSRHTHSLYLSPNSFEELKVHRSLQAAATVNQTTSSKKHHSASMRIKPYRETLSATKKSKSFMIDTYPEFELSPHRRESRIIVTDDIKRSPRPSTAAGAMHLSDDARSSFDRKTSLSYDIKDVDFDPVLRPFRQGIRKSSLSGSMQKMKRKSISEVTDDDDESDRKRKRIVCIIMTVFLCLVCASVFVVVVTLTHSSVTQVQNQTRKIYTFSRDSPIHYNGTKIFHFNFLFFKKIFINYLLYNLKQIPLFNYM